MEQMHGNNYRRLMWMTLLSFISMYVLMYSMVNSFENVFSSWNQVYMAGVMASPMVIIELLLMSGMYQKKKLKGMILAISVVALVGFFTMIRQQTAIGDKQFLRSMIPHHAGAILMCREASIRDPEIKDLCKTIVLGQQAEIDQMKAKLNELSK
jgi:uncharacterized protein (DUF305 family)